MKVGFKISIAPYETMEVVSNEHPRLRQCLGEVVNELKEIDHPSVKRFREYSIFDKVR